MTACCSRPDSLSMKGSRLEMCTSEHSSWPVLSRRGARERRAPRSAASWRHRQQQAGGGSVLASRSDCASHAVLGSPTSVDAGFLVPAYGVASPRPSDSGPLVQMCNCGEVPCSAPGADTHLTRAYGRLP